VRVLFVIPELSIGGTERQVLLLARALMAGGHTVRVLALRKARRPQPGWGSIDVHVLGDVRPFSPRLFFAAYRALYEFRPGVVHTFLFGFDLWVSIASRVAGIPTVLSSRRQLPTWRKRRHLAWQNAGNRFVDGVIANSEAAAEYACCHERGLNRGRVFVLPNAYEPRDERDETASLPLPGPGERCILNVANLWPGKGQDLLLAAFRRVHERHPDTRLWLVGEGDERQRLEQQALTLGVAEAVVFAGRRHDIPSLLARAALYVHASRIESSPNAVLEALAHGTPVIACADGGTAELLAGGRYGRLAPSGDTDALAIQMEDVLSCEGPIEPPPDAFRKAELPERTPERAAERLLAIYTSLAPSHPPQTPRLAVYTIGNMRTASTRYRCMQFFTTLQTRGFRLEHFALPAARGGRVRGFVGLVTQGLVRCRQLRKAKDFDAVLVQKGLTPSRWKGLIAALRRSGVPVLFDFDDAVTCRVPIVLPRLLRPLQEPDEPEHLIRMADGVLAGNRYLRAIAEKLRSQKPEVRDRKPELGDRGGVSSGHGEQAPLPHHRPQAILLPTVIDCRRYWYSPPAGTDPGGPGEERLVLLWTGQRSTLPYLVEIIPELARAAQGLLPHETVLRVVCDSFALLDGAARDPLRIERVEWSLHDEIAQLAPGDVGLMPQPDDEWTRGKCGAKALQFMALGKPVIASATGFAIELVSNGENGILVTADGGWERAVRDLAGAPDLCKTMGRKARETVEDRFSLERHAPTMCDALATLCTSQERRHESGN
jgi:glycosyltransferase involved in cell wall biosynthesis